MTADRPSDPPRVSADLDEARSERRFRLLAEAIPQIVWSTRADGHCDYQNRRWAEFTGMTPEESAGSGWMECVHPDDRPRCLGVWATSLSTAERVELEYRLRRSDGVYRWFLVRAEPIRDDEDRVVRWFGTSTDIDDRKRAEDAKLRRNEEFLRLAASSARLGYWDWDMVEDRITWSESLAEIAGTSPEVFGDTIEGFSAQVHPDDRELVRRAIDRAVEEQTPYEAEFRFVGPDGSIRWALAKGQVYRDLKGRPVRMAGIDIDITRRKESEEKLRRSEERFRASTNTLFDCFGLYNSVRDGSGRIVDFAFEYLNETALHAFGLAEGSIVGRSVTAAFPGLRTSGLFDRYCRVVETGEPLDLDEAPYQSDMVGRGLRLFSIRVSKLGDGVVAAWRDVTDQRHQLAELTESRRFESLVAEFSPAVVYILELATGRTLHARGRPFRSLGYGPDEFRADGGEFQARHMHPEDQARFRDHARRLQQLPDGVEVPFEYRVKDAEGRWHWFLSRDTVFERNSDATVKLIMGAALEATGRVGTEDLLRLEGEDADLAFAEVDYLNDTISLQPEARDLLGLAPDQLSVPRSLVHGMFHEDDRDEILRRIDLCIAPDGDGRFAMEHRIVRPDGEVRWHSVRKRVFFERDADGEPRPFRSIMAMRDVTERRAIELALIESDDRFRRFCGSDIIGIVFADIFGGITYANDEYLRIIGYTREDFEAGKVSWSLITPPEWLPVDFRAITEARAGTGSSRPYEKEYLRKNGSRISVLVGFLLFGEEKEETVAFVLDMSERKKAERTLEEADRRKDEFLATLSHELRNPLAAISNALKLLRAPGATEHDRDWAGEVADRQLKNTVRLIDDLLDVSRIRSGKIQLRRERLDLSAVIGTALGVVRPFLESRKHQLEISITSNPMPVVGDPTRLEQVLTNLLNNAAKYTDEGGEIRVIARREGSEAVVRVVDNGVGIAPDMLPVIFDLFAQVDNAIDRSQGGLGIGLSLVQSLAEMHGGRVYARSRGLGHGSEFTVRLPLAGAEEIEPSEEPDREPPAPAARAGVRRILLVDDNPDTLRGMARLLKLEGHEVVVAHDGPAAVESARAYMPDVALLDIGLPGLNGYEVAQTLRRDGSTAILIAISGFSQERDRDRSRESGFDHHLSKPVDLNLLLAIIGNLDSPARPS